jgi:hypothetical protein
VYNRAKEDRMASKDTEPEALDFSDVIRDLGHGATNSQASKLLAELVNACEETGGKGKITLTISVAANGGLAEIAATAKAMVPQPKLPGGTYFKTKTGGLVTEDPRQTSFGAKVLSMSPIKRNTDDGGAS